MPDRIERALQELSGKEKKRLEEILKLIQSDRIENLDVKKLKNRNSIYRVRKGDLRIIFQKTDDRVYILAIERRTDTTYSAF